MRYMKPAVLSQTAASQSIKGSAKGIMPAVDSPDQDQRTVQSAYEADE